MAISMISDAIIGPDHQAARFCVSGTLVRMLSTNSVVAVASNPKRWRTNVRRSVNPRLLKRSNQLPEMKEPLFKSRSRRRKQTTRGAGCPLQEEPEHEKDQRDGQRAHQAPYGDVEPLSEHRRYSVEVL